MLVMLRGQRVIDCSNIRLIFYVPGLTVIISG